MVMPITLLTGYLGAGKTSLLNNILKNTSGYKVAVIVNDIGEVNVDTSLIEKNSTLSSQEDTIVPMQNGCICCTLKMDLIRQIVRLIKMDRFDHILIEASGVCEPMPIAQTLSMIDGTFEERKKLPKLISLDNIVTVVDAHRMSKEFSKGNNLLRDNIQEDDIENLLIQQIEFCNTVILNKVDMVTEDEKKEVLAVIRALQPKAEIIETNYGKVDCSKILDVKAFNLKEAMKSTGWAEAINEPLENEETGETDEYGIATFIYRSRKPFLMSKFTDFAKTRFPRSVIRCKGPLWFKNEPNNVYMFEQAGEEIVANPFGSWIAANNEETQEIYFKKHPELADKWDKKYGDRRIELVFIGKNMNKDNICKELDNCLSD